MGIVKCLGCGSTSMLPDGKDSMLCLYCGSALEREKQINEQEKGESLIKVKPEIINGDLSLNNRKIKSISELIIWFSDSEINTIKHLDLSNNEINSLEGLDTFQNVNRIDLDNNKITMSDADINVLNNFQMNGNTKVNITIMFNTFKSLDWVEKVNFDNILNTYHEVTIGDQYYEYVAFSIQAGNGELFFNKTYHHPKSTNRNPNTISQSEPNSFQNFFGRISILDWVALVAPYILAILIFNYNKHDKTSTLGFLDFLVVFLVIAVIIRFYPFFSKKEKTGRSFESQHGTVEEYTTIEGKINTEHGWWIISLIHIGVIILILKVHGFGTTNVQPSPTEYNVSDSTASESQHNISETKTAKEPSASNNKAEATSHQENEDEINTLSTEGQNDKPEITSGILKVMVQQAHFYNEPNLQSKRSSYLIEGQKIKYIAKQNNFIKVPYTNKDGVVTEGWMLLSDFEESNKATSNNNIDNSSNEIYTIVEQMPSFAGGETEYNKFIAENFKYPEMARRANLQGISVIQFTVEKDGSLSNIHIQKSVGHGDWGKTLDDEALRLVKLMPNWEAGKQGGNAVRVNFNLPVSFKLQ